MGAPDLLCTVVLASPIGPGGSKRGVGPESLGVRPRDPSGYQTTLCAVPGVSWAYQTWCVRCLVALGWPLGAPESLCAVLLASRIGAGGSKRGVGPESGGGRPGILRGIKPCCVRCPVCLGRTKRDVCGAWWPSGGPWGSRLAVHGGFGLSYLAWGQQAGGGTGVVGGAAPGSSEAPNHAVHGARRSLGVSNAVCAVPSGSSVALGRSRLSVHTAFGLS